MFLKTKGSEGEDLLINLDSVLLAFEINANTVKTYSSILTSLGYNKEEFYGCCVLIHNNDGRTLIKDSIDNLLEKLGGKY